MSLVGTRPILPDELEQYELHHRARIAIKPGIDWQREKWKSGFGSKFIRQGEKNAVKYADEIIVLSKGVQDYFENQYQLFNPDSREAGDYCISEY